MIKKSYILKSEIGLTSRISANLVSYANRFSSQIKLQYMDEEANLKSIMNVMAMIIRCEEPFSITYEGDDEIQASEFIDNYLKSQDIVK